MSKKTREPLEGPDLFSAAGLSEHVLPEVGSPKYATPAAKPAGTPQRKTNSPLAEGAANERYLRDLAVAQRYGVSRQTVWRWAAQGMLPVPFKLSEGVTRWRMSDLIAHEASLPMGAKVKVVRSRRVESAKPGGQQ